MAPGQRLRKLALLGLVFAVVVALAGLALRYVVDSAAPAARLAELEHDNGQLRIELDQYRVQLEMERATRGELERQVGELNEQVSRLNHELGFYTSHSDGARRAR
ncbi:hypothetical protein [Pseudothauera lacus]|uniref:hypothetical protein n=1 Tax=Pseudothauera lacus TaxID=2136175 RepID=UPI0011B1E460|nr:hypothetical protein [Pseudothauera lacus]